MALCRFFDSKPKAAAAVEAFQSAVLDCTAELIALDASSAARVVLLHLASRQGDVLHRLQHSPEQQYIFLTAVLQQVNQLSKVRPADTLFCTLNNCPEILACQAKEAGPPLIAFWA